LLNYLYCLDENYNFQALNSINSLLEQSSEKINLYIIHKSSSGFKEILRKIPNFNQIESLKIYDFQNNKTSFPDLEGAHVSEATYYRMFIDEYLTDEVDYLTYLDSDIICLNDPTQMIKHEIDKMKKENTPLGAKTEGTRDNSPELFQQLGLKNDNHFNAGMIIIDFQKWKSNYTKDILLRTMDERKDKIIYWDQDILNIVFDDNYTKIDGNLNYNHSVFTNININSADFSKIVFMHYSGKSKPWGLDNILNDNSNYYQESFRKLGMGKYHIVFDGRYKTLLNFVKILLTLKFLKMEYSTRYVADSFKSLFK
jgi:UDP-glucose:(glucosyl)LPS alpha-1,3-glucosyltransferase